jgi:hypothetical protein
VSFVISKGLRSRPWSARRRRRRGRRDVARPAAREGGEHLLHRQPALPGPPDRQPGQGAEPAQQPPEPVPYEVAVRAFEEIIVALKLRENTPRVAEDIPEFKM